MDELEIQGKKYISSKRAAEITGYAKDYVGQLARSSKVPATRVGRAWYVSLTDIKEQAGIALDNEEVNETLEITEAAPDESESKEEKKIEVSLKRLQCEEISSLPRTQEKKLYSIHGLKANKGDANKFKTWSSIKYENDDGELLPALSQKDEPTPVTVTKKDEITNQKLTISDTRTTKNKEKKVLKLEKPLQSAPMKLSDTTKAGVVASSLAFAVVLLAIVGITTPSEAQFSFGVYQSASTGFFEGFDPILDYFFIIFDEGIVLLEGFLATLRLSFETFVLIGLDFILNLF